MTFSDYAGVTPGLFVGAHPEPEDPFDLGANVVDRALQEAFDSGDARVRKLLLDSRWVKR